MSAAIGMEPLAGKVCSLGCTPKAKGAQESRKTFGGLAAPMPSGPRLMDEKVRVQFLKTEFCRFYPKCRKGDACPYAHNQDELRIRPVLNKTSLCQDWKHRICLLRASECSFAHGYSDMHPSMPLGKSRLKASKIKDPTPLRGEASTAVMQAEQMPHNCLEEKLDALKRVYADMLRSCNHLDREILYIKHEITKLSAGSAEAHLIGSCEPIVSPKMVAEVKPAWTDCCPTGLYKVESTVAEPELPIAHVLPWCIMLLMTGWHPKEAAAAEVNSQVRMVAMNRDFLANMLSSVVPDHYED